VPIVGGTQEQVEARAQTAREKYGAMTITQILDRIIIWTIIGYIVIAVLCFLMYYSPIDDRLLTTILLIFVGAEMLTEYALWAFTYQGMRKTEAPLQDLQKFSTLTKEGWRRAEIVLDITTPFFKWLEGVRERIWPDWRDEKNKSEDIKALEKVSPIGVADLVGGMTSLAHGIETLNARMARMEREGVTEGGKVKWGTDKLEKD